jgi:hypothetical protein
MNQVVQKRITEERPEGYEADNPFDRANEPNSQGQRSKLFYWLAGAICIFAVLYGTSYLALFSLPAYAGVDMRSQLTADYSAWAFLVFQPVDPAIIEEIRQEQGLPEQIVVDGSFWPTQAGLPLTGRDTLTPTSQATLDDLSSSPIAAEPPFTSTSVAASITPLPGSTVTPRPTQSSNPTRTPNPQKSPKPRKSPNPERTPKPPKTPKQ